MGFTGYDPAIDYGRLVQGEILGPLVEYIPLVAPVELEADSAAIEVVAATYQRVLLMTQDCDLEQDARVRLIDPEDISSRNDVADDHRAVRHVLLCPMFEDIKTIVVSSKLAERVKGNHDARYHAFKLPPVDENAEAEASVLPQELFIDFRRFVSLPTNFVYDGVSSGAVKRLAVVPELNRLQAAQRFFGYLSRIPVP